MTTFVDTSALIALLDGDEESHLPVRTEWERLAQEGERLVTSNYVVVESVAVVQRRFGTAAVRDLADGLLPLIDVEWIDEPLHEASFRALRTADRRSLSLVDLTSFELMRELGVGRALTLDAHFAEQGFRIRPAAGSVHEG